MSLHVLIFIKAKLCEWVVLVRKKCHAAAALMCEGKRRAAAQWHTQTRRPVCEHQQRTQSMRESTTLMYFNIFTSSSFCNDSEWAQSSTIWLCVIKSTNATASQPSKDWHIGRARADTHVHQRCPAVFIQMALQTCIGLNRSWRDEERSKLFYQFNNSIHVWRSGWEKNCVPQQSRARVVAGKPEKN